MKDNFSFKDRYFWILFIVLFSSGFVFFKTPFEFYFHYFIFLSLIPFLFFKYGAPKFLIKLLFVPLFVGLVQLSFGNNEVFSFIKILGGLTLTLYFSWAWITLFNTNINKLFYWYCMACWVLTLIGFLQIFSFLLGFEFGYNYSWFLNKWGFVEGGLVGFRVNSILSEPTYLATALAPAIYVSVHNIISKSNFIFNKLQSSLILVVAILTTSSIGYLGILISILLCTETIRIRYIIFGTLISLLTIIIAYNNVKDFRSRLDAAKGLWIDDDYGIANTNNSSFVLFNNLHVAKENLVRYPVFGTGLGSDETAFKKFTLTKTLLPYDFEFNVKDGNSLFIRLCTETGLLGLGFILLMLVRGFIYKVNSQNEDMLKHKIISQSLFVLLVLVLIRQGNYMLNGLPLLFLLYHYNGVQYKRAINHE